VKRSKAHPEDHLRRAVITSIMCNLFVILARSSANSTSFSARILADALAEISPLLDDGLVILRERDLEITSAGEYSCATSRWPLTPI